MRKKAIKDNMVELEHLQLKFVTFVARFMNNPVQAFYELKLFRFMQRERVSAYFEVISLVLSSVLEMLVRTH